MTCRTVDLGNGYTAIVCDRGRKPAKCTACKERPHSRLCDFPLTGDKAGKTCSVRLCDRCAVRAVRDGKEVDYCPPHARIVADAAAREQFAGDTIEARVRDWCADRFVDVDEVIEYWTERAAIREYEAGVPRFDAEHLAFAEDVVRRFGP